MTERGITLTFASGARVDLLDEEAAWLRDELVKGEYTSPKRDAGTVVDRALGAIDKDTEPSPADMTPAGALLGGMFLWVFVAIAVATNVIGY